MFKKIYGFTVLNLKILLSEKVVFLWAVALPVVVTLFFQKSTTDSLSIHDSKIWYMKWFWCYIIIASFVNGIGLQLARMREYGLLKTYVLISGSKSPFVIATFLTQIIFSLLSLSLYNLIVGLYFNVFSFDLVAQSFLLICISIPFGLFTLFLTVLPLKIGNLGTVINIILYPLFILAFKDEHVSSIWNLINPFSFVYQMNKAISFGTIHFSLIAVGFLYLLVGALSFKKMNLISYVQR